MITEKFRLGVETALATTTGYDIRMFYLRMWDLAFEAISDQLIEACEKYNAKHQDRPVEIKAVVDIFLSIKDRS
jgi:ABC-type antimicrobial peptide transport system permease subunit